MLRWKRVEISAGALLLGAALYYLDEQGVLLMAFCACALHELGHWLVIRALGGRVTALRITCVGAEMRLSARCPLGCWQQIAAALAGPAVNLLAARMAAGLGTEGAYCFAGSIWRWPHSICCPLSNWTAAHPLVYPGAADSEERQNGCCECSPPRWQWAGSRSAAAALAGEGKPHSAHYRGLAAGAACSQTMPRDTDGMKILLAIR